MYVYVYNTVRGERAERAPGGSGRVLGDEGWPWRCLDSMNNAKAGISWDGRKGDHPTLRQQQQQGEDFWMARRTDGRMDGRTQRWSTATGGEGEMMGRLHVSGRELRNQVSNDRWVCESVWLLTEESANEKERRRQLDRS